MLKKISTIAMSFLLAGLLISPVAAQNLQDAFPKAKQIAATSSYKVQGSAGPESLLTDTAGLIVTLIFSLLGVIFIILTIYGGFLYMNARGNEEQTKKAIAMISQALIGLVIIMAAYAFPFFIFKFFI